jgi:hypothetical protein
MKYTQKDIIDKIKSKILIFKESGLIKKDGRVFWAYSDPEKSIGCERFIINVSEVNYNPSSGMADCIVFDLNAEERLEIVDFIDNIFNDKIREQKELELERFMNS